MKWFDRFHKLRLAVKRGRVHTDQKEILSLLKGKVVKTDLPSVIVEPADESELGACLVFATEQNFKVAVSSDQIPMEVRGLAGAMLVRTTRLVGTPHFSADKMTVRIEGGYPAEAFAIDLSRAGKRWMPLLPVPTSKSVGELIATGWEGLRNWNCGGTLAHVRSIDWMPYSGHRWVTGRAATGSQAPDMSSLLFDSRGALGIITALELALSEVAMEKTAALFQLRDAHDALKLFTQLVTFNPAPEAVIYWGETASEVLRRGNDGTIAEETGVAVMVEWGGSFAWPEEWNRFASPLSNEKEIASLWQDLFRFPRTVTRIYPARVETRLRLPAPAIVDLEAAARELGKDSNLQVAVWGTVEAGYVHLWALLPDEEQRTRRRAEGVIRNLVEIAVDLDGSEAPKSSHRISSLQPNLRKLILDRCDPEAVYLST